MGKIGSFITGAALGAAAALLLAPRTGEQTRAFVSEKAGAFAGEAKDFGAGFPGSAQDLLNNLRNQGASIAKDAQGRTSTLVADATSRIKGDAGAADADELREKIEAARRRIAAQVMENAEASKAVDIAGEAEEAVAEVAEEAEAE